MELAERFRVLAETASDIVYSAGPDRVVTWVAPSISRALGWRPAEIVGTRMSDLVHPDDMAWSAERRDRLYAGDPEAEAQGGFTLRMRTRDGGYRWVKTTLTVHRDAAGAPTGFTGGMVLVDDLVAAREEALREETLRRLMADALLDSQVLLEPVRDAAGTIVDFRCLHANRAACREYGRRAAELDGMLVSEFEPGAAGTGLYEVYARACDEGETTILDAFHYVNRVTGTDRHYDTRVVPIPGGLVTAAWRDVTEEHRMVQRLAASDARFRLLAEHVNDVVQLARGGVCIWVSPSITEALGWTC
ncbi:MAG: PAS domain-containing protein [Gaiellales bacterium]